MNDKAFYLLLSTCLLAHSVAADTCDQRITQAEAALKQRDYDAALTHYQTIAQQCPKQKGDAFFRQGLLYQRQGTFDAALTAYEAALAQFKTADEDRVAVLNNLAHLHEQQAQYAKAEPLREEALQIRQTLYGEQHEYVAYSLNELARLYNRQEQYRKAEPLLKHSLAIKEQLHGPDHTSLASSLNNLAMTYTELGEYAKAETLYQRALNIREQELGADHIDLATPLNNLARLYSTMGDFARAAPLFQQALALRQATFGPLDTSVANSLSNLAFVYQSQRELETAAEYYRQALNIWQQMGHEKHPDAITTLHNLAALYKAQGLSERAEATTQHVLQLRENALGSLHPRVSNTLNNLAVLYQRGNDLAAAEQLYLRAYHIAEQNDQPALRWLILSNLSEIMTQQKYKRLAIFFGKQAVNTLQSLRINLDDMEPALRKIFVERKSYVYEQLAHALLNTGRLPEAQQVLAMLKEEAYFDFIGRDATADTRHTHIGFNQLESNWLKVFQPLTHALNQFAEQIKPLEQALNRDATTVNTDELKQLQAGYQIVQRSYHNVLQGLQTAEVAEPPTFTPEQWQAQQQQLKLLGAGTVLVNYLLGDEQLSILLTTAEQQRLHTVDLDRATLSQQVLALHQALQDPAIPPLAAAEALHHSLIAPIQADLQQFAATVLMVSLDGALHYVPLAALYDGEQFLAQRYAIVNYNPAAATQLTTPRNATWRVAGLGLSDAVEGFNPLPTVPEELEGIIRRSDDSADNDGVVPGKVYLNQAFANETLKSVLMGPFSVLHIASHFVFKPGTETASFLLLGNGDRLTLAQIRRQYRFDNLDLVTLSACETAVGAGTNGQAGNEIEGFSTLVQHQGARAVLATLWPVNDNSTGQFMQRFYQYQVAETMNKATALQRVQQQFIAAGAEDSTLPYYLAHPYYWAAFVLMGNWL